MVFMGNCISSKARTTDVEQKHSSSLLMATLQIVKVVCWLVGWLKSVMCH
ncbi:hypothetical protein Gotur_027202 [Gossypium turneri]